jgi:hypothetical protein
MIDDGEEAAIRELHRRQNRLTNVIGVACMAVGLAVTALLFVGLVALQWRWLGEAYLSPSIALAALAGVGGSVGAGFRLRRVLLKARAPSWIDELAANHRERRRVLEEIASVWG